MGLVTPIREMVSVGEMGTKEMHTVSVREDKPFQPSRKITN